MYIDLYPVESKKLIVSVIKDDTYNVFKKEKEFCKTIVHLKYTNTETSCQFLLSLFWVNHVYSKQVCSSGNKDCMLLTFETSLAHALRGRGVNGAASFISIDKHIKKSNFPMHAMLLGDFPFSLISESDCNSY